MSDDRLTSFDIIALRESPTMPIIDALIDEIIRLGGPLCIDCEKNQCRHDTGLCSLCDMKAGSHGRRIKL